MFTHLLRPSRVIATAALLAAAIVMLASGLHQRSARGATDIVPELDNLPVIFVAHGGTIRSYDHLGNKIATDDWSQSFGGTGSTLDAVAANYVTNGDHGNLVGADSGTGNVFMAQSTTGSASTGRLFTSGDSGVTAPFGSGDVLALGDLLGGNDVTGTRQTLVGQLITSPSEELLVAHAGSDTFDLYSYTKGMGNTGPAQFAIVRNHPVPDLHFSAGDQIATAHVPPKQSALDAGTTRLADSILVADPHTGHVRWYSPTASSWELKSDMEQAQARNGFEEPIAFHAGDGFAVGNVDGVGADEFVIAHADSGMLDIYQFGNFRRPSLLDEIDVGFQTGSAVALADVTGNGMDDILVANPNSGDVSIFTYNICFDQLTTTGSKVCTDTQQVLNSFHSYATFNVNFQAGDLFTVLPVRYRDSDADGLHDDWEKYGLDLNNDGQIDDKHDLNLPAMGADPNHKDLFVELDLVNPNDQPTNIQGVMDAFSAAPVDAGRTRNPDGNPGITLHIDEQPLVDPSTTGTTKTCGLDYNFYTLKQNNFDPARRLVFRYGIQSDVSHRKKNCTVDGGIPGGVGELGGNDFVSYRTDAANIMHELGHTLGLNHGGDVSKNCKPNYLSVMNYGYDGGIYRNNGSKILDYSPPRFPGGRGRAPLPTLNEQNLDETVALDPRDPSNQLIFFHNGAAVRVPIDQNVNWNQNKVKDEKGVQANIDQGPGCADASDSGAGTDVLTGFDDWHHISLPFRQFGASFNGPVNPDLHHDPNSQEIAQLQTELNTTDLTITKSASPSPAVAGENLVYTLTVTNQGPNPADAVQVVDTLPSGTSYVSDDSGCTDASGMITCDLGSIPANESRTITITVKVSPSFVYDNGEGATLSNTATVTNTAQFAQDSDSSNNTVTQVTKVVAKADLSIVNVTKTDVPLEISVGQSGTLTLAKVITNNGPSGPMDVALSTTVTSSSGAQVSAIPTNPSVAPKLGIGEERSISEGFTFTCKAPGTQTASITNTIAPNNPADTDPNPDNNQKTAKVSITCVVPVAINIEPGGSPNAINVSKKHGVVPVAVLTTKAGEYGLPLAFDATKIDPTSVHFGPADQLLNVTQPGGSTALHGKGHLEDSYELDETTQDGDLDMVLQFPVQGSGLTAGDTQACVRGTFTTASGDTLPFFGCDAIDTVP